MSLPSLTGLRWTAALLVFLFHVNLVQYFGGRAGSLVNWAFSAGDTGVSFFFMLSGFVLAWSSPGRTGIAKFWRRRLARVYPLHVVTALLALAMAFTFAPMTKPLHTQLAANLLMVQSWFPDFGFYQSVNPVSWSLACEAFFYFLFPVLLWCLRRVGWRGNLIVAALSTATVLVMPMLIHHLSLSTDFTWTIYYFPLLRLPEFVLGIALAEVVRAGRWRGPGLAVSLILAVFGYFLTSQVDYGYQFTACTVIGFAALIAAAATADLRGEPSPWRGRLMVKLGEISFAFYMIHLLVMRTGEYAFRSHPKEHWPMGLAVTAAAFAIALSLAWLLHTYVEGPGRRLMLRSWGRRAAVRH
ncbi:peptidoglycan/LPS O-acetylase OafA/YrhL [Kitasatospora sp. MAA4]|uniref:acyltransferase family protein n=1 Tax=Kitasatospora sp. MAA4 TaxID=3035093 RepID=UPI0024746BEF|nr:acyltransferase [Kitasatospora sp. MAA4]MDH6137351.1 peptidoglycan/LPS O-acetylase OafA/YrhL [Kitasatospora sp. MAA4]